MATSWFVEPDTVRLDLGEGNWIEVKRQLTAGEERRIFARCVASMVPGEKMALNPEQVGRTKLVEYIVAWGGPNLSRGDKPVKWSPAALDDLAPAVYGRIVKAVDAHEEAQAAERDVEKNDPDGAISSTTISPSVN